VRAIEQQKARLPTSGTDALITPSVRLQVARFAPPSGANRLSPQNRRDARRDLPDAVLAIMELRAERP
jgi:hypothetical protein